MWVGPDLFFLSFFLIPILCPNLFDRQVECVKKKTFLRAPLLVATFLQFKISEHTKEHLAELASVVVNVLFSP